jgi:hypothetical protein
MRLTETLVQVGPWDLASDRNEKKNWSERLSRALADYVAGNLRDRGFENTKPFPGGAGERAFQGGLGPKKVDVSYADERHGLLLAVSVKTIGYPPFGKNLKNRFGDLMTEAITLHMRFPYSVVCALFAFPEAADIDRTPMRLMSTFDRACKLFSLASGRREYTGPGEKFENVTAVCYRPISSGQSSPSILRMIDCTTLEEIDESRYFDLLRTIYNDRNPHAPIGDDFDAFTDE